MESDICAVLKDIEKKSPFLFKEKREPFYQAKFLLDGNMKGQYLGACLDSCRWGAETTVMYPMSLNKMMDFIKNWMQQNESNFPALFNPMGFSSYFKESELPHVHRESCPRDGWHKGTTEDMGGRVRCAHRMEKEFGKGIVVPYNSFDEFSQMNMKNYLRPSYFANPDEDGNPEFYDGSVDNIERAIVLTEPTTVTDICYAILSDRGRILPFETVLKRLNLRPLTYRNYCNSRSRDSRIALGDCRRLDEVSKEDRQIYSVRCLGHPRPCGEVEFRFDGWKLAHYVQKWHEQLRNGAAPWLENQK